MPRLPLSTPIRGDQFIDGQETFSVDELTAEGVKIVRLAGDQIIPWHQWGAFAFKLVVANEAKDPCPNHDAWGRNHVGKQVHVKTLGTCYNKYRCLACGRTYEVDSSD